MKRECKESDQTAFWIKTLYIHSCTCIMITAFAFENILPHPLFFVPSLSPGLLTHLAVSTSLHDPNISQTCHNIATGLSHTLIIGLLILLAGKRRNMSLYQVPFYTLLPHFPVYSISSPINVIALLISKPIPRRSMSIKDEWKGIAMGIF